jgi:nicotinamidase-related amidase
MRDELLRTILDPEHTAVVTTGVQRGNLNSASGLPALANEIARAGTVAAMARVCNAARTIGVRVLHCTLESRLDGAGQVANCRVLAAYSRNVRDASRTRALQTGSDDAKIPAELGPDPRDIVVSRLHGITPFPSTPLDQILRNLGVRTIVATGVSVNLNVMGLVLNAADLGYQVVLVRDAVAGVPAQYAQDVIDNSLSMVSTVVTVDQLLSLWPDVPLSAIRA